MPRAKPRSPAAATSASPGWTRRLRRPRLTLAFALGIAVYVALFAFTGVQWRLRFIVAWDIGTTTALVAIFVGLHNAPLSTIKTNALRQDSGKWAVLVLTLMAATASLVVIASEVPKLKGLAGGELALHVAFVVFTIIVSWAFVHAMFAVYYAHEYYMDVDLADPKLSPAGKRLLFPGHEMPRYADFLYFAFVLGMTFQVSDVEVADARLRRIVLWHGVSSFMYSTGILALAINLVAGLIEN
ncbi:MAG: DUF1345 domain-containing protein [Proteobacteria bacterium]|nr:DUF1345 domain-containing protein [Pseudomonadota bacterium]